MKVILSETVQFLYSVKWKTLVIVLCAISSAAGLDGPNVCMVQQKYNITKRVKYRAPMAVRTYVWCFNVPPRCSKWTTEMRDLTKLETEERIAEVAVCCPGYKMTDIACVPICPNGKTGEGCKEECPINKWGPNCAKNCINCNHGSCSPVSGKCRCSDGWKGESCEIMITSTSTASTTTIITKTTVPSVANILTISTKQATPSTSPKLWLSSFQVPAIETTTSFLRNTTSDNVALTAIVANISTATPEKILFNNKTNNLNDENEMVVFQVNHTSKSPLFTTALSYYDYPLTTLGAEKNITDNTYTTKLKAFSTLSNGYLDKKNQFKTVSTSLPTVTKMPTEKIRVVNEILSSPKSIETQKTIIYSTNTWKPQSTIRSSTTNIKFKPKEIWIKPAQKGDVILVESKSRLNYDSNQLKVRNITNRGSSLATSTPKTIIVSIIPTSITYYSTLKKLALSTSHFSSKHKASSSHDDGYTKSMAIKLSTMLPSNVGFSRSDLTTPTIVTTAKPHLLTTSHSTNLDENFINNSSSNMYSLSSMFPITNQSFEQFESTNTITTSATKTNTLYYSKDMKRATETLMSDKLKTLSKVSVPIKIQYQEYDSIERGKFSTISANVSQIYDNDPSSTSSFIENKSTSHEINLTDIIISKTNNVTTEESETEETFHILTEPEHITAVMGERDIEKTTTDLVYVMSVAGGVMMIIITVAIVIVMIERCRRPRYEEVRKMNDIHMQVMIDRNDVPPPYIRSIFNSPLPDPPSDKCHYQPISTLDRNLQQFMRPVVVKTHISPIMLENFRDILECHYDHLPRRSNFDSLSKRCTESPSMIEHDELRLKLASSVSDLTIEALKCEAKLDIIDTTTSEPLYAEIPCWRPPSEHAIEIMTVNGEAVTEL